MDNPRTYRLYDGVLVPAEEETYRGWVDPRSGIAQPVFPSTSPRVAFISSPPTKGFNLSDLLPESLRSTSASSSSERVWSRSRSQSSTSQNWVHASITATNRRRRTTSVAQPAQNTWVSRSQTPQSDNKPAAPLKVVKIKSGSKETQTQKRWTKADKINAIARKGKKAGQLSNGVWFKTPEDFTPIFQQAPKRAAFKKQKAAKKKNFAPVQKASPETLKTVRKLRKKVKQCKKIQEKLDNGMRLEVLEAEKLNQLDSFRQQLAVLESQISTGKKVDSQGFQLVQKRRR